ncbi:MAG: N-acetylmuramic acid 6-phosphate etherase [Cardiobacteriaceae bacterium]|nr:N-acetylmuramic acid 6-phosphate etherase [Cardiobacteriaceae bacterium]
MASLNLAALATETRNAASLEIDRGSALDIVRIINAEDAKVAPAITPELPAIAKAVDAIVAALQSGGRLVYIGAGTSGRLGILDATECPPTYGTDPEQILGIIAGGKEAVFRSVEHAEDDEALAVADLQAIDLQKGDILVGIAASGRTPYVVGALDYARQLGATTVGVTCTADNPVQKACDIAISPIVGAEVVTGSTRMKAGTAQKLVLNMLTTAAMIRLGKVYGNLMVDVKPSNAKLVQRQKNIVAEATGCTEADAAQALDAAGGEAKTAIVMLLLGLSAQAAREALARHHGMIRNTLQEKENPHG